MRNSWKRTSAFVLAFTLVAAPLSINQGIFKGVTGLVAHAEDNVTITYTLGDSEGDGWGNNAIHVYAVVDSTEVYAGTIALANGASGNDSIVLEKGVEYEFKWDKDSDANECSFTFTDENGNAFFGRKAGECANDEDGAVIKQFTAGETSPKIANASVTLNDAMGLNFYVDNIASAEGYTVKLEGKCLENEQELALTQKGDKFFVTANVYAKDVNEKITATLYKGETAIGNPLSYSVADYLSSASTSVTDKKSLILIKATKAFGAAAADYFYDGDHGFTAAYNDGLSEAGMNDLQITAAAKADDFKLAAENAKVSLVLNSLTSVRLYVKDFAADQFDDSHDAKSIASSSDKAEAGYPSYFEVKDLIPQNYGKTYTLTLNSTEYKFSPMTWANRVLSNGSASDKNVNMAKATTAFYLAAKNYVAE